MISERGKKEAPLNSPKTPKDLKKREKKAKKAKCTPQVISKEVEIQIEEP
jgi:hypothetical protein